MDIIVRTCSSSAFLLDSDQEKNYSYFKLSDLNKMGYYVLFLFYRNKDYRGKEKKLSKSVSHYRKTKYGKVISFNRMTGLLAVNSYKNSSRNFFNKLTSEMKIRYVEPEDATVIVFKNKYY